MQRGHNKQVVFATEADYRYYIDNIREWKENLKCKVYAYCLMTNHIHLIIDPGDNVENLALFMKRISGRQTRYVNRMENRRGTLWEGRYKSSPIDKDEYFLKCCCYIELNPVRAGIVKKPEEYRWSSYRNQIGVEKISWLDIASSYVGLGKTDKEREKRYKDFVCEANANPSTKWDIIRQAVQRGQLTGRNRFIDEIEKKIGRRVEFRKQGRPNKGIK